MRNFVLSLVVTVVLALFCREMRYQQSVPPPSSSPPPATSQEMDLGVTEVKTATVPWHRNDVLGLRYDCTPPVESKSQAHAKLLCDYWLSQLIEQPLLMDTVEVRGKKYVRFSNGATGDAHRFFLFPTFKEKPCWYRPGQPVLLVLTDEPNPVIGARRWESYLGFAPAVPMIVEAKSEAREQVNATKGITFLVESVNTANRYGIRVAVLGSIATAKDPVQVGIDVILDPSIHVGDEVKLEYTDTPVNHYYHCRSSGYIKAVKVSPTATL